MKKVDSIAANNKIGPEGSLEAPVVHNNERVFIEITLATNRAHPTGFAWTYSQSPFEHTKKKTKSSAEGLIQINWEIHVEATQTVHMAK